MIHTSLAYIGPETMLPLASGLAAVAGGVLLGWRWVVNSIKWVFRSLFGGKASRATRSEVVDHHPAAPHGAPPARVGQAPDDSAAS